MQPPHHHEDDSTPDIPEPIEQPEHGRSSTMACIGLGLAGTVAFVVVQSLALGIVLLGWRIATGATPGLPGIADGDDVSMLAALALTELLLALALLGALAIARAPLVMMGLTWQGGVRSLRATAPLILLFGGIPLAATIVTEGRFAAPGTDPAAIALIVVLAPLVAIAEELWFRGFVLHLSGGAARPLFAAAWSSVLFGAVHLSASAPFAVVAVNAITVALVVGVGYACIRIVTGTLVGPIVGHALIDIIGLIALGGFDLPDEVVPAQAAIQIVAATVAAALYVRWMLRNLAAASGSGSVMR